ncbi:MAG: hypothetical protein JSR76_00945 [Verrucomicrobia bacterium]|nr:hypothetical protein [Verrucomicrobiota bacterium]
MKKKILGYALALWTGFACALGEEPFMLHLKEWEKATIYEIISEVGERNMVMLFLKQRHMNSLGDSVRHVPPLQFLGFVLTDDYLKDCLQKISDHPIKWSYFIDGFGKNMQNEFNKGKIIEDLPGFSELVGSAYEKLLFFSTEGEWDRFVRATL